MTEEELLTKANLRAQIMTDIAGARQALATLLPIAAAITDLALLQDFADRVGCVADQAYLGVAGILAITKATTEAV